MAQINKPLFLYLALPLLLIIMTMIIPKLEARPQYLTSICSGLEISNNSQYQTNLNTLLRSLAANATTNNLGFYATSVANGTNDAVYGLFFCRGDQNTTSCRDCVQTATTTPYQQLSISCSPKGRKVATTWYDKCIVRYSNESIFGKMVSSPSLLMQKSEKGRGSRFTNNVADTLNNLAEAAAAGDPIGRKYATKVTSYSNSKNDYYALAQCTPDLSTSDCERCLRTAIANLSTQVGAGVFSPSCNVRYEIYPFFRGDSDYPSPPQVITGEKKKSTTKVIVAVIVPIAVLALLTGLYTYYFRRKAEKYHSEDMKKVLEDFTTAESLMFDFGTLQTATKHFADDQKLGGGGFGNVYKGILPNGQEIAVKRLSKTSHQGMESFKNEAVLIAKLQHKNLVRLLGFCLAGEEKLLVYEYVPNKSFDYLLFDPRRKDKLDWPIRYNIITGIARGLLYLHEDSRPRIIHRDLKAANILLETDMNPKISDFGLARMFKVEQTEDDTSIISGTYGYMAPEYAMHGQFSTKSDVYSFGVLLLEIVSGMKINSKSHTFGDRDLLTHAWKSWKAEKPFEFMDPTLRDSCSYDDVISCIRLGLSCVQESANARPTMSTIVFMLNTNSATSSLPPPRSPRSFYDSSTDLSVVTIYDQQSTTTKSSSN